MNNEQKILDLELLVERLIEKSKAGKLTWKPTADRQQFVTSVGGGNTSFKIRLEQLSDVGPLGQWETYDVPRLDMLDEKGFLIWKVYRKDVPKGQLDELYKLAQRIGNKVDDRLEGAIEALNKL